MIARRKVRHKKGIIREYTEAILVALVAALILRVLVVQAFRIPTGSMKDTLLIGDFLLVNKFIYGVRTPSRIPLINKNIPHTRLPAFKKPKRGEIVVFKYPLNERLDYIKRCIGLPGDTLEVRSGNVYINGKAEGTKEFLRRWYDPEDGHYVLEYRIVTPSGKKYTIRHYEGRNSAFDNFGPMVVPKKGITINLSVDTGPLYQHVIEIYEKNRLLMSGDEIYLNGKPARTYTFKEDYYFMMGDNRDNSADSRAWGPLPFDNVLGQAMIIYFSWDSRVPIYKIHKKIRWQRITDLIK